MLFCCLCLLFLSGEHANTAPRLKVVDCRTMFPVISVIAFSPTQQQDLTVFHVNPAHYPAAPLNMDTGDALGDLYFDLRSVVTPIECAHPSPETGRDCDNQEVVANDLVITKLVLSVTEFGEYGRCNICVNGTDHHGNNSCTNGAYWCSCGDYGKSEQCGPAVGRMNLTDQYAKRQCRHGSPAWECWKDATAQKTGGVWYSTVSAGYCGDGSGPAPPGCTWSVKQVVKVVNKSCSGLRTRPLLLPAPPFAARPSFCAPRRAPPPPEPAHPPSVQTT